MIIAIDGPAASGKGTLARRLAAHYHLPHLDTGLLYRATAQGLLAVGLPLDDEDHAIAMARGLALTDFDDNQLRGAHMGEAASIVAAIPAVREALIQIQRDFAGRASGAVLDGRDIGTIICPEAEVKIFVTASQQVRAERRVLELRGRGESPNPDQVLADIARRDERDYGRANAPLKQAADAKLLDTSALNADEAFNAARLLVERVRI